MQDILHQCHYFSSAQTASQIPEDGGVEVAFAGRSNAGKSSALNAVTGRAGLARTSKLPGRTQTLIFFRVVEQRYIVDLPGYGFAAAPRDVQQRWAAQVDRYLRQRAALRGLVLCMDIRHPLKPGDQLLLDFCRERALPAHLLLTKADKLSAAAVRKAVLAAEDGLPDPGLFSVQAFSALRGVGVDQARDVVRSWLGL
jgi:GTP-binding protein